MKSNAKKHYNWLMGADMYLATSCLLCDEMLKIYISPKKLNCLNNDQQIDKKCRFTSCNPDYEMLMPLVFNLKHGIELYLKALIMRIEPNQEYPSCHNLLNLFNKLMSLNNNDKNILDTLNKIKPIIEKYYYGTYCFAKNKNKPDINNEAERYPEYRNNNCYKISKLYEVVCKELLSEIKEDIIFIQNNFRENIYKKLIK